MAVGVTMRKAANRAVMLEETARLMLYCRQFGGEMAVIPPDWVQKLEPIKDFL
jgi:ribulose-5-phosphate 4-epimerase/fuculose-1-phosphate aldolase